MYRARTNFFLKAGIAASLASQTATNRPKTGLFLSVLAGIDRFSDWPERASLPLPGLYF